VANADVYAVFRASAGMSPFLLATMLGVSTSTAESLSAGFDIIDMGTEIDLLKSACDEAHARTITVIDEYNEISSDTTRAALHMVRVAIFLSAIAAPLGARTVDIGIPPSDENIVVEDSPGLIITWACNVLARHTEHLYNSIMPPGGPSVEITYERLESQITRLSDFYRQVRDNPILAHYPLRDMRGDRDNESVHHYPG